MKRKKILAGLACIALLAAPGAALAESMDVGLRINNEYIATDETTGRPYINDAGRTMIPLRLVSETMDYTTEWQKDGSIHITSQDGSMDVSLKVGSTAYTANGTAGNFNIAPVLKNNRTYLPARDFTELYGNIYWDNGSRIVWIYSSEDTLYEIIGYNLVRSNADGISIVNMPEGYEIKNIHKRDILMNQRVIGGTGYVAVNYSSNINRRCSLFRDDGGHMTYLSNINGSSSFWVEGNTIYHTQGTDRGPWSGDIQPNILIKTVIGGEEPVTESCDVGFAINACTISVDGNILTAVDEEGKAHEVNLDECFSGK